MISNWAGNIRFDPAQISRPTTEEQVSQILVAAHHRGTRVRVIGSGHSFTPLIHTDGVLMSLDALSGVVSVEGHHVTLRGGTRLRDIAGLLAPHGLALPNMGDVDPQSIAGAVSTATHGTGLGYTSYSGCVTALRIALPDGRVVDCSKTEEPELFEAARVGLGAMGVIVELTMECVPRFDLRARETTEPIAAVLTQFLDRARQADHLEFFWFPGTSRATVKQLWRLPEGSQRKPLTTAQRILGQELLGNGVYGALVTVAAKVPPLAAPVRTVSSMFMAGPSVTDTSAAVFVTPRRVRFRECEYSMPLEAFPGVVRDVEAAVRRTAAVTFPLEVRVVAGDDTWLGPATGRDSVYVAVHRYHREDFTPIVRAVEPVFRAYGGRPHWGKEHTLSYDDVTACYPHADDARQVRRTVDPDGVLLNPHVESFLR